MCYTTIFNNTERIDMSDMQAMHLKLVKCSSQECSKILNDTLGMDGWGFSDYLFDNNFIQVDGTFWKYTLKENLDASGFTKVLNKTKDSCELITLFYNGGCHEDEIVEDVLKGK